MSLGSHVTATGVPGNGDRARAATHDARAIFAESGPQREAVFSADVQRRARKQAQRRRCRAAWASREQWRGAAGSDVHRVAPRGRRSARAGLEALGRLKRTSALIAGGGGTPLCIRHTPPYRYKYRGRYCWQIKTQSSHRITAGGKRRVAIPGVVVAGHPVQRGMDANLGSLDRV